MKRARLQRMTDDEGRTLLESIRWPEGPVCPHCGSDNVGALNGKSCRPGLKKCRNKECRKQFTVTVGTIFESSHIGLGDWMYAFSAMCASKKGISALQLQRMLDLGSYETAWFMCHRIRHAMNSDTPMLKGAVEVDETYVGGKHRPKPYELNSNAFQTRADRKVPVMALVQRGGNVKTRVLTDVTAGTLKGHIRANVDQNSMILTDEHPSYKGIGTEFKGGHFTVNHSAGEYSDRFGVHSNTAESFFSLIKRGVYGNFHHVSKKHLFRYCHEFEFRWNYRFVDDYTRTMVCLQQADGKRLTYQQTGKHA